MHPHVSRRVEAAQAILDRSIGAISNALGTTMREEIRIRKEARELIDAHDHKTAGDEIKTALATTGIDMPTIQRVRPRSPMVRHYETGCGNTVDRDYNCGDTAMKSERVFEGIVFCDSCRK